MTTRDFRPFVLPPDHPRRAGLVGLDAYGHAARAVEMNPQRGTTLEELISVPFKGITTDGELIKVLYSLAPNNAPIEQVFSAVQALLGVLTPEQRNQVSYDADAIEWRRWHNAEIYLHHVGLRLEEQDLRARDAIFAVLRSSLSPTGYEMVRKIMIFNDFLGDLLEAPAVFNELSYNFSIFGTPSSTDPWGWAIFGHHLAINCFFVGEQMVITPTFYGAEPNYIDAGEHKGMRIFEEEEKAGVELIQSLSDELRKSAVLYDQIRDPALPPGRCPYPGDQLHLGGAYRDNRVIPYEGASVANFDAQQRKILLSTASQFLKELPKGPLEARLQEIERHFDDTHLCWIGATDGNSPFYYRIQSPVVMIEFDQHAGVFLGNPTPEPFHVHVIVRTPNGGDYGRDLLRLHYEQKHQPVNG